MLGRELHIGQHVSLGRVHQSGEFRHPCPHLVGHVARAGSGYAFIPEVWYPDV